MTPVRKPIGAPTLTLISQGAIKILQRRASFYAPAMGLGMVACVLAWASLWIAIIPAVIALWMRWQHQRWSLMAKVTESAPLADYLLTDALDLRWMAWAIDLEPRAKLLIQKRRPNGQFRSVDMREIEAGFACDAYDAPKRAPYHGDYQRAHDDLNARRTRERRALWQASPI